MALSYAYISISVLALAFLGFAFSVTIPRWRNRGSKELALMMVLMFIASFCILLELIAKTYSGKLLWRNLSQIGLFILPASSFNFIMVYTEEDRRLFTYWRKINFIYALVCIILIFTNDLHHIMRISVELVQKADGPGLAVRQTLVGKIAVALNTLMNVIALVRLWVFMRNASRGSRSQIILVFIGFLIPIVSTYLSSAFQRVSGFNVPASVSFLIGICFILFGMYRYDFLATSPIARDWALDEMDIGIIFTDSKGAVVECNAAARKEFGDDVKSVHNFITSTIQWQNAISTCQDHELDLSVPAASGDKTFRIRVHHLTRKHNTLGTVSLVQDITQEKAFRENLMHRAEKDGMTQILNRNAFEEKAQELLNAPVRLGISCSLFMLDIDDFKHINDTFGHMVGDEVLKGIVGILRTSCREQDVLGRVGGDEFAILVLDCDASHSINIAQRIHKGLATIEFKGGDQLFHVSVSIGLVNQAVQVEGFKELYDKADQALLQAKATGKSRTVLFPSGL